MKGTLNLFAEIQITQEANGKTIEEVEKESGFKLNSEEQRKYIEESLGELLKDELGDQLEYFKVINFETKVVDTEQN